MSRPRTLSPFVGLALLASCGIFGLSQDEQKKLSMYQQNAAYYWEGQRYTQALDAVRRGLEIQPDDYKLQSIAAGCYLAMSRSSPENLRRAEILFEKVHAMRSVDSHRPYALLGYARCHQQLGLLNMRMGKALHEEAQGRDLTDAERAEREARATEHEGKARFHWNKAERAFQALVDREEQLRRAHRHLMEIRVEQGDYEGAVAEANATLERNRIEQESLKAIIDDTMSVAHEREKQDELSKLVDEESRVRSVLAQMHFRKQRYELSERELTILLQMDPRRSNDYYNRARVYEALGRTEEARQDHRKFLATTKLPVGDERVSHAFKFTQN